MNLLGVSCYFHDAALVVDGRLLAAAEEERLSRLKHDHRFPVRAIEFCLKQDSLSAHDAAYGVFYEKSLVKFERILSTIIEHAPRSFGLFRKAATRWLLDKLWIRDRIREHIAIPPDPVLFVTHHLSHAASALFCSQFSRAAILTVDGVGEWTSRPIGRGEGRRCELVDEIGFPHSIGLRIPPLLRSWDSGLMRASTKSGAWRAMARLATRTRCDVS